MNAVISILTPGNPWVANGTEVLQSISANRRITVVYPLDSTVNILCCTPALVTADDGTVPTDFSTASYEINRVANTWLLVTQKNILSIHPQDEGTGLINVIAIPEYLFPNYDTLLGGDQNYGILARVLHHETRIYQNV